MVNTFALKAALRDIDAKGIKVGDVVTVTWKVDPAYAAMDQHEMSKTGPLASLDRSTGWFEISPTNSTPGHLRSSITWYATRMVKVEPGAKKKNLFIEKAGKRG